MTSLSLHQRRCYSTAFPSQTICRGSSSFWAPLKSNHIQDTPCTKFGRWSATVLTTPVATESNSKKVGLWPDQHIIQRHKNIQSKLKKKKKSNLLCKWIWILCLAKNRKLSFPEELPPTKEVQILKVAQYGGNNNGLNEWLLHVSLLSLQSPRLVMLQKQGGGKIKREEWGRDEACVNKILPPHGLILPSVF